MRYIASYIFVGLIVMEGIGLFPYSVFAAGGSASIALPDSSISISGSGSSFDFFADPMPSDSINFSCFTTDDYSGCDDGNIYVGTSTIVGYELVSSQSGNLIASLNCDGNSVFPAVFTQDAVLPMSVAGTDPIHCHSISILGANELYSMFRIWYVPYDTRVGSASSTSDVSYRDWLYVSVIIIFLLCFVPIGLLYSLIRPSFDKS